MKKFFLVTNLFILLGIFFVSQQSVLAIEYGGLGARPLTGDPKIPNSQNWFIYSLAPGESKEDVLIVQNAGAAAEDAVIYPADSTPSSDGGFALKQQAETMTEVGSWITMYPGEAPTSTPKVLKELYQDKELQTIAERCQPITKKIEPDAKPVKVSSEASAFLISLTKWCQGTKTYTITIPSQEQRQIPFVISVPKEVDVGEHTGGLMIQKAAKQGGSSGNTGIILSTRVGVRIYETVPGEIKRDISLTDLHYTFDAKKKTYSISLALQNKGNASADVDVVLHINDQLWPQRSTEISRTVQILRNDTLVTNFEWQPPFAGWFTIQAEAKGFDKSFTSDSLTLWIIPWFEVETGLGIILLLIIILTYRRFLSRRIMKRQQWQAYTVKRSDSLMTLAEHSGVSWKKIVKINRVKRPYILSAGQTILLPRHFHEQIRITVRRPRTKRPRATKKNKPIAPATPQE